MARMACRRMADHKARLERQAEGSADHFKESSVSHKDVTGAGTDKRVLQAMSGLDPLNPATGSLADVI